MNPPAAIPFLDFLRTGVNRGGFETEDTLAALLPLFRQVRTDHDGGKVAPLDGVDHLHVLPPNRVAYDAAKSTVPRRNTSRIETLQTPEATALDVIGESRRTTDLDSGHVSRDDLRVETSETSITRPVFLPHYRCWEHRVEHHDALTDVFSLGLLLASLACSLDLTNPDDLRRFVTHRTNLFELNPRLNPVLASCIVRMTELNRHQRAQDLAEIIARLENYREQSADFDTRLFDRPEFRESPLAGKRRLIQSHLRDRLFEISRRNRLIYFKPTLQTLNLTLASVPLLLDYRNIQREQLFVWHPALAATVADGAPMSLGKYLRFEDAPYIPGVLDKIISEARRDRAEYGFAQLRLVLCFLRWNNLKEDKNERIHSPLLLLPVELTRKKGVRDNYVLDPTTSEAEVNPALRHHLETLYNLTLPEIVDLKQTSLDAFHEALQAQIQASEPGVTLRRIDRPRIELIHERARQRLDQYRRRQKTNPPPASTPTPPDYSYDRDNPKPLGLQLFLNHIRPAPLPLRDVAGAPPAPRLPQVAPTPPVAETERRTFTLREDENQNPYLWDFDLCSLTLGNFHYRKMTLVRDYTKLIETDLASNAFDAVFSLAPRPIETPAPSTPGLADHHWVVACDATQASAIARARTGTSYIIQGPPGTGKSQTITNLIADYVARGRRVLFVCEKRAAIDVVFHRLRQQGLDELCCLIHDSQTDKKAFIQDLKQTYEKFLDPNHPDTEAERLREATLRDMEEDLAMLRRFSECMCLAHPRTGIPPRALLQRLIHLRGHAAELPPETNDLLPDYPLWLAHGQPISRLHTALVDLHQDPCFARHPLRWIGKDVLQADRPLETLSRHLDQADAQLDALERALESSGLPSDLWDTFAEIRTLLTFAVRARPLAERHLLGALTPGPSSKDFDAVVEELEQHRKNLAAARERTHAWRDPFSPTDTESALAWAKNNESSLLRFLQPTFWQLRKQLHARYDFARHAIPPAWSKILQELAACHEAQAQWTTLHETTATRWRVNDVEAFRLEVETLRHDPHLSHPSVQALLQRTASDPARADALFAELSRLHDRVLALDTTLATALHGHDALEFPELKQVLRDLRDHTDTFAELSLALAEIADLPEPFAHALRHAPLPLDAFEGAMAHKSLNRLYQEHRETQRMEGRLLQQKMQRLTHRHREWLGLNARAIRQAVRRNFLDHVALASLTASQLTPEQKAFKKSYAAGRRDLEHEFSKTMRYKSIRDLAGGDAGQVIRDLKPIWLMSPLGVSDTLPLDPNLFDVVIFDEASQIPLEEAIPAAYRSHQVIVVGDEMQLPPTSFFVGTRTEDDTVLIEEDGQRVEMDLDADSFLTQSARNLPSTLLAWHYRSRSEALISFSNAAFYSGNLFTIPDRQRSEADRPELIITPDAPIDPNLEALLTRSISFHFLPNAPYENRRNPREAAYIAQLVRGLLHRQTGKSIGIVAFSEAQQTELEEALEQLAEQDPDFATRLEAEYVREENDVFCGLFVKNLENVQGDERDIILLSVCYGPDATGRMLMNFGPINQRGGEKRLNVIFSRAKHHMAVVTSIRHSDITNDYNDGANNLRNFLRYAEAVSKGDATNARLVLENLNPLTRRTLTPPAPHDAVVQNLAEALRRRGHTVDLQVGQSRFRCDLAIRNASGPTYQLGILVDTESHYANPNLLDRYLLQPTLLEAFGWRCTIVLAKDWYHQPDQVLSDLEKLLTPPQATPGNSGTARTLTG